MKRIISTLLFSWIPLLSFCQSNTSNDFFGNIGKIYVVVGVILILFAGIVAFLFFLERRIAALEQSVEDDWE